MHDMLCSDGYRLKEHLTLRPSRSTRGLRMGLRTWLKRTAKDEDLCVQWELAGWTSVLSSEPAH